MKVSPKIGGNGAFLGERQRESVGHYIYDSAGLEIDSNDRSP